MVEYKKEPPKEPRQLPYGGFHVKTIEHNLALIIGAVERLNLRSMKNKALKEFIIMHARKAWDKVVEEENVRR